MGVALQAVGVVLIIAGGLAYFFIVHGIGAEIDLELWRSLREPYEQVFPPDRSDLMGRLSNAISFVVLVGPGIAFWYAGRKRAPKS